MVASSRFQVPRRAKVSIAIVSAKYLGELDGDLQLDEVRRWEIARAHRTWGQQYVVMVRVRVRVTS